MMCFGLGGFGVRKGVGKRIWVIYKLCEKGKVFGYR